MNIRIQYAKRRAKKNQGKKVPQWMVDRIKKEAEEIAALYGRL